MEERTVRVLVIEDNAGDARLIREMLADARGTSFEVAEADRLAAGRQVLTSDGIDAVLLDLGLPDSQGLETFLQLHAAAPRVPIVVLSGLDDEAVAVRAVHEGAQDYLVKGQIDGAQLARSVRYAVARKETQDALRESEQLLHTVITNAPVVLFAIDREGIFTLSEGKGLAGLGLRPGEAVGRSVFDMYRETPEILENMRRALAGEAFTATVEVAGRAYETHHAPIRGKNGETAGVIGVATDISDRKRAEDGLKQTVAELQEKTEELESFTYSVSHDLKEPLRTLEAFSKFLLEDYADRLDEQGRDYLLRMGKASARLKQMIEELLVLSRISRPPEVVDRVDIGDVIANIVAAAQATIDESRADVQVEGELPRVAGDLPHIEQIFGNLISNALKFNRSDHPVVRIGLRDINGGVATFYVRDNGIGIDPEHHERIFDVFQRLHRREEFDGTGAGLAIVKRAVEALGGRVWVDLEVGAGATFYVTLPLWQGTAAPERAVA